jgi:hypothetical protein
MEMIGYILGIGNILNGGNEKTGQADGFEISVLGKVGGFRDNNGESILEYICRKLKEQNP